MTKVFTQSPVQRAFTHLCRAVDSPLARTLISATHKQLCSAKLDPAEYSDAKSFREDYLLVSYLSKYKGLNTGIDTKAVALSSFAAAEDHCALTNRRLKKCSPSIVDPVIHRAIRLIANLLGTFDESKFTGKEGWGPGATFEFTRTSAYLDLKIANVPFTVTPHARATFEAAIKADVHWCYTLLGVFPSGDFSFLPHVFEIVRGSRITTVPKNAKTDRTIAIEPRGNMFLQKAIGAYVRSRLKRVGVNLDDQGINQRLAELAKELKLATLDLKAASDTVSTELIYMLLPLEWACYLDKIRSRMYTLDGKAFAPFHKLSSMGNGFTFEIESLVFWALTAATREGAEQQTYQRVNAIYGDDIICPQEDAWQLATVLNFCGFELNVDKSFFEGNFFESCGRHYFDGVDVTPIYQKEIVEIDDELAHIRFHNRIVNYGLKTAIDDPDSCSKFLAVAHKAFQVIENRRYLPLLPFGAEGNDGYLINIPTLERLNRKRGRPLVKFNPSLGWGCPVVRPSKAVGLPAVEEALYANQLRVNDRREAPRHVLDVVMVTLGFDGNIESRQETKVDLKRSTRWVTPAARYVLTV